MNVDFHTADNAEVPHVKIYDVDTEYTICEVPIHDTGNGIYDVDCAERIALHIMCGLKDLKL